MPKRNVLLLLLITTISLVSWLARDQGRQARQIGEVLGAIERSYLEPVDADLLEAAAVEGIMAKLDEHSALVAGAARRELEAALDQEFGGVGLELMASAEGIVVHAPLVDGPAWRAGVRAGDMIASIDGVDTRGMSVRDAVDILRGDVGSTVAVGLRRASSGSGIDGAGPADDSRMVTLVREIVRTESVLGDRRRPDGTWDWFVEGEPGIACVRITSCGDRTLAELDAALATIAAAPAVQGLVLDLRGNPGGLLGVAIDVCDRFLDDGVIVSTRRRGSGGAVVVEPRRATPGSTLAGVPIAVLIDGLTASAAEIVAACLQDHGRAVIVGSRSFGKGTVQSIIPLSDGRRLLKLTTAEYVRPDETSVQRRGGEPGWGVAPDVGREVDLTGDVREAHRAWRRRRDMLPETSPHHEASPPSAGDLPRGMDPTLALAIDAIVSAAADFRGEEEAAGDADEAAAAGDAPGPLDGRGG